MEQLARPWSLRLLGAVSLRCGEHEPALHHFGSRSAAALLARLEACVAHAASSCPASTRTGSMKSG